MHHVLWIAGCGSLGAVCRYGVNVAVTRGLGHASPWGTLVVNLLGCLLLGALIELTGEASQLPRETRTQLRLALGVGFLGAFTTFSTFSAETLELIDKHQWLWAAANILGSVLLGLLCVRAGMWLAKLGM